MRSPGGRQGCRHPDGDIPADLGLYSHAIRTGREAGNLADTAWIVRACELTRAPDPRDDGIAAALFRGFLRA